MLWTKLVCFIFFVSIDSNLSFDTSFDYDWQKYKDAFNKKYSSDVEEKMRKSYFEENVKLIARHNLHYDLKLTTFTVGLNQFSDMSESELLSSMKELNPTITGRSSNQIYSRTITSPSNLPRKVDWRDSGVVTRIKDQADCNACWAFAATAAMESAHALKTGKLVELSEQNLIDCTTHLGNEGCKIGSKTQSYLYVMQNKGISTEASYPYMSREGTCKFDAKNIGATVSSYFAIKSNDEVALQQAVATIGPVAVSINAYNIAFKRYQRGVYNDPNCNATAHNHALLVIGYGDENNEDYWLVKNSWGTQWGMKGFGLMSRNRNNQCGIARDASFPII